MDRTYWNTIAGDYDGEIFDVRASDKKKLIEKRIKKLSINRAKAIDFGCGTGKFLPYLAQYFAKVEGYDLSAKLVQQATKAYQTLDNVSVETKNLAKPGKPAINGDFGLCVNVLITDSHSIRSAILQTISRSLKKSSPLLLVVPSLESAYLSSCRLSDWNMKDGLSYRRSIKGQGAWPRVGEGVIDIDFVPTKHYSREELQCWLPQFRFKVNAIEKVEYEWNTEFEYPPRHMQEPYPWDWLVEAERI